jgi:ATP-dependent Lhr-like helicase
MTFYLRESSEWLQAALEAKAVDEAVLAQALSADAQRVRALLRERGAAFTAELERALGLTKLQVATALWELATAGLASADGFDQMRAMMDPRRRPVATAQTAAVSLRKRAAARTTAGRWSLFGEAAPKVEVSYSSAKERRMNGAPGDSLSGEAIAAAKRRDVALDAQARVLLCRYGVLFRELLVREANAPKWRDLLPMLRRLEARGEIRGGRFVAGAFGEQYALKEAVDGLREMRRVAEDDVETVVAAADPLNLVGIVVPGERVSAVPGKTVRFVRGAVVQDDCVAVAKPVKVQRARSVADVVRGEMVATRASQAASVGLFRELFG